MAWTTEFKFFIKLNPKIKAQDGEFPDADDFLDENVESEVLKGFNAYEVFCSICLDEGPGKDIWFANYTPPGLNDALQSTNCLHLTNDSGVGFAIDIADCDTTGMKAFYLADPLYRIVLDTLTQKYGDDAFTAHYGPIRAYW